MRVRRAYQPLRLLAFTLALFGAFTPSALAETRVLLFAGAQPHDAELRARIGGQTRDLPVQLVQVEGTQVSASDALAAAQARGAQLAVWTERTGPAGLRLYVLDVESGALRTRDVSGPEREALASSTTAEMAALVVRSELTAMLDERSAAVEAPAPPPAPPTGPVVPPRAPAPAASPAPLAPGHAWLLAAGYRPSRPIAATFAHALALAARREQGRLSFGVAGQLAAPLRLSDDAARVRLLRGGLRLEALLAVPLTPSLRLQLGAAAGLTITGRQTRAVADSLRSERGARTLGATLGPLAELHWRGSLPVGLWLGAGLDGVLFRTDFVYDEPSGRRHLGRLARLEPWMTLGFFVRLPEARKRP